jgi:RNA polymerase sigma-70 factor (ECF subfamily)
MMSSLSPATHAEDAELVQAYRAGNEEAFRTLLNKHLHSIYAFIYQMVRDVAVAEDLAQETFMKAWRHLGRYDAKKPFRTWLFAIAKNGAYDWIKKKKAFPFSAFAQEDEEEPFVSIPDTEPLPDDLLIRQDAALELDRTIQQLPEKYRSLIVLVYQEGFSLHEAADIFHESYNTVKSRHQRAVIKLRALLSRAAPDESGSP